MFNCFPLSRISFEFRPRPQEYISQLLRKTEGYSALFRSVFRFCSDITTGKNLKIVLYEIPLLCICLLSYILALPATEFPIVMTKSLCKRAVFLTIHKAPNSKHFFIKKQVPATWLHLFLNIGPENFVLCSQLLMSTAKSIRCFLPSIYSLFVCPFITDIYNESAN